MSANMQGVDAVAGGGIVSQLRIRVSNVDRAGDYFRALFGWRFQREQLTMHAEQRLLPARTVIPCPVGAVFSDDPRDAPVRVEFEVPDVASTVALVHRLGGRGDAAAAFDDQGVPLAFAARREQVESDHVYAGQIGVVILSAPDTARACAFQAGLSGVPFTRSALAVAGGSITWHSGFFQLPPLACASGALLAHSNQPC